MGKSVSPAKKVIKQIRPDSLYADWYEDHLLPSLDCLHSFKDMYQIHLTRLMVRGLGLDWIKRVDEGDKPDIVEKTVTANVLRS